MFSDMTLTMCGAIPVPAGTLGDDGWETESGSGLRFRKLTAGDRAILGLTQRARRPRETLAQNAEKRAKRAADQEAGLNLSLDASLIPSALARDAARRRRIADARKARGI